MGRRMDEMRMGTPTQEPTALFHLEGKYWKQNKDLLWRVGIEGKKTIVYVGGHWF